MIVGRGRAEEKLVVGAKPTRVEEVASHVTEGESTRWIQVVGRVASRRWHPAGAALKATLKNAEIVLTSRDYLSVGILGV